MKIIYFYYYEQQSRHPKTDSRGKVRYSSLSLEVNRSCGLYLLQFCSLRDPGRTAVISAARNLWRSSQFSLGIIFETSLVSPMPNVC